MPAWPGTLPTTLLVDLERSAPDGSLRGPADLGPGRARPIDTATPIWLRGEVVLTGTQAQALELFYETTTNMGSVSFTGLDDPLTGDAHDAIFLSRPSMRGLAGHDQVGQKLWRVRVELALLP